MSAMYLTEEQERRILADVAGLERDSLIGGQCASVFAEDVCCHVKALLAEVESLRKDVRERAAQKSDLMSEIDRLRTENAELRRKAEAFDWLCDLPAVDDWAVMMTGQHDPLRAVEAAKRAEEKCNVAG